MLKRLLRTFSCTHLIPPALGVPGTVTGIFALGAVIAAFPADGLAWRTMRRCRTVFVFMSFSFCTASILRQVISCIVDRSGRKGCMVLGDGNRCGINAKVFFPL